MADTSPAPAGARIRSARKDAHLTASPAAAALRRPTGLAEGIQSGENPGEQGGLSQLAARWCGCAGRSNHG